MQFTEFSSTAELNEQFAQRVASLLADAISQNGRASLVVSGGRTPLPFFPKIVAGRPRLE